MRTSPCVNSSILFRLYGTPSMLQQLFGITRNTFVESLRQPIMVVLYVAGTLLMLYSIVDTANTLDDDTVQHVQMGLSAILLVGLIMAGFTATGVLARELENKTVLTVISKPVTRPLFILGKFLGVTGAISLTLWPLVIILMMTTRHGAMQTASDRHDIPVIVFGCLAWFGGMFLPILFNYLYGWVYTSTTVILSAILMTFFGVLLLFIDKQWHLQGITAEFTKAEGTLKNVFLGLMLTYEALLIIIALAIALSTRLNQVLTILVTIIAGVMMTISESTLYQLASADLEGAGWFEKMISGLASIGYHVIPNLQYMFLAEDISLGRHVPASHLLLVSGYAGLFVLTFLALAIASFQTREVG